MEQNIYLDVYFGFNFLMDFFVLLITKIITKNAKRNIRMVVASMLGALYATIILVFNPTYIIQFICTYVIVAELMLLIAYGKMKIQNNLKTLGIIYLVTFILSGVINAFYYSSLSDNLFDKANEVSFGKINWANILPILVVMVICVTLLVDGVKRNLNIRRRIFDLKIVVSGSEIDILALPDTGNSLVEPITKKPVSVIEKECLCNIDKNNLRYIVVPYNSVGKSHGIMDAFIADKMIIGDKEINNTIIGIHEGKLSQSGQYNMILHPDLVEKGD